LRREEGYRPLLNGRYIVALALSCSTATSIAVAIALLLHKFCKMSKFADCADDTDFTERSASLRACSISFAAVLANH